MKCRQREEAVDKSINGNIAFFGSHAYVYDRKILTAGRLFYLQEFLAYITKKCQMKKSRYSNFLHCRKNYWWTLNQILMMIWCVTKSWNCHLISRRVRKRQWTLVVSLNIDKFEYSINHTSDCCKYETHVFNSKIN